VGAEDDDKGKAPPSVTPSIYQAPIRWEADEHASRALMRQAEASENIAKYNAEAEKHKAEQARQNSGIPAEERTRRELGKVRVVGGVVLAIMVLGTFALPAAQLLALYLPCVGVLSGAWAWSTREANKPRPTDLVTK
jgi:hypothetical protein